MQEVPRPSDAQRPDAQTPQADSGSRLTPSVQWTAVHMLASVILSLIVILAPEFDWSLKLMASVILLSLFMLIYTK